jgi:Fe-S cluster biogenesis protein NfuA
VDDVHAGTELPLDAPARLDDPAVRALLARLDEQLAQLEALPGFAGDVALTALAGLTELYGQALARMLDLSEPTSVTRMLGDELIGHLLAMHGLHPESAEARVTQVLDGLREELCGRGGTVELDSIDHAVAVARIAVGGCGAGSKEIEHAVRRAVLTAAPELAEVAVVPVGEPGRATFVPLDALFRSAPSVHPR